MKYTNLNTIIKDFEIWDNNEKTLLSYPHKQYIVYMDKVNKHFMNKFLSIEIYYIFDDTKDIIPNYNFIDLNLMNETFENIFCYLKDKNRIFSSTMLDLEYDILFKNGEVYCDNNFVKVDISFKLFSICTNEVIPKFMKLKFVTNDFTIVTLNLLKGEKLENINLSTNDFLYIEFNNIISISYSNYPIFGNTQLEFFKRNNTIEENNVYYSLNSKGKNIKNLIVTFPGLSPKYNLRFPISGLKSLRSNLDNVLTLSFYDISGTHGGYLCDDLYNNPIKNSVINIINRYIIKYSLQQSDCIFYGNSKGANIAMEFIEYFNNSVFFLCVPQLSVDRYYSNSTHDWFINKNRNTINNRFVNLKFTNTRVYINLAEFDYQSKGKYINLNSSNKFVFCSLGTTHGKAVKRNLDFNLFNFFDSFINNGFVETKLIDKNIFEINHNVQYMISNYKFLFEIYFNTNFSKSHSIELIESILAQNISFFNYRIRLINLTEIGTNAINFLLSKYSYIFVTDDFEYDFRIIVNRPSKFSPTFLSSINTNKSLQIPLSGNYNLNIITYNLKVFYSFNGIVLNRSYDHLTSFSQLYKNGESKYYLFKLIDFREIYINVDCKIYQVINGIKVINDIHSEDYLVKYYNLMLDDLSDYFDNIVFRSIFIEEIQLLVKYCLVNNESYHLMLLLRKLIFKSKFSSTEFKLFDTNTQYFIKYSIFNKPFSLKHRIKSATFINLMDKVELVNIDSKILTLNSVDRKISIDVSNYEIKLNKVSFSDNIIVIYDFEFKTWFLILKKFKFHFILIVRFFSK